MMRPFALLLFTPLQADYLPGDIVTCTVPPKLPHIMIVRIVRHFFTSSIIAGTSGKLIP